MIIDVTSRERLRRLRALREQLTASSSLYPKVCERIVHVECGPPASLFTVPPSELPRCGRLKPRLPTVDDDWAVMNGGKDRGYR